MRFTYSEPRSDGTHLGEANLQGLGVVESARGRSILGDVLELDSSFVVVVLAGFVADFIVNESVGELKLLRNILDAVKLESGGIGDTIAKG